MGKMRAMTQDLAAAVFSDGWTAVNHHPIVNIIMGVRSLHTLRASIDMMGQEKTMDFIAALILEHIKEIGEDRVFVVCMDGVCKGCPYPGKISLGVVFRVYDTRDGLLFEKRWILSRVHQDTGQSHGRYTSFRDGVERALLS